MDVALAEKPKVAKEKRDERRERLLKLLTYEIVDGKPIYYRGYKDVLAGKKTPEEVMGSSYLQGKLIAALVGELYSRLGGKYAVVTNELTLVLKKGTYRSVDIALFPYELEERIEKDRWVKVPPVVVVEVDVKAEIEREGDLGYILKKSRELIDFGVKRVVWILTSPRSVLIFESEKPAVILGWEDEVEIWEGVKVRLTDLLKRP